MPAELVAGQTVSHYRVLDRLGQGGMGVVYRARDEQLGREVALKVLPAETSQDEAARARLIREARTASALNHPSICTVYEVGESAGACYISMELIEGQSLRDLVRTGALSPATVLQYGEAIAEAVAHAHGRGVVHRDLKSANVMVTREGRVKLLDFGIARRHSLAAVDASAPTEPATRAGVIAGTLHYVAPEILRGATADTRSDVWSLGVILYEMASGELPFSGKTPYEITSAILRDEPAPLPRSLSPGLAPVIARCLAKEPGDRYQRVEEVCLALRGAAEPVSRKRALQRAPSLRPGQIRSVAVLPLANLSGDPSQEYLSDGITELLLTDLAQIASLRVISRTSSNRYKGTQKTVPEIAAELGVDALVEGSVLCAGERIRVTAQLLHAPSDRHIWAKSYETAAGDVLALQSELVQAIAGEIRVKVTPRVRARLSRVRPVNHEAHEAYLKGIYHFDKLELARGMEYFQQAVAIDPSYAAVWGRIARGYYYLGFFGAMAPHDAWPRLKDAAARALSLDDSLADAYGYRALSHLYYDWDWEATDRELRRAVELSPSHAELNHARGHFLMAMGRLREGVEVCTRAVALDPVGLILTACLGWHCLFSRRPEDAVQPSLKALRMDPNFFWAHLILGWAYELKGQYEQAIAAYKSAVEMSGGMVIAHAALGHAFARSGFRGEAGQVLADLAERSKQVYVSSYDVATIHAGFGDADAAFTWLDRAAEERASFLLHLQWDPRFDPLRGDPRFRALLERIGLPEYSTQEFEALAGWAGSVERAG